MLESVSFDQLRMFLAAADEGSFSAAARRVRRTQSAVSEAILSLEAQFGVALFDRAGRYPKLTKERARGNHRRRHHESTGKGDCWRARGRTDGCP